MYYVITNFKPLAIMKTSELKMATAVNVVANATSFKSIDDLKETDKSFGGINFIVGDVITLPSEFCDECFQKSTYNNKPVPYMKIGINGKPTWVPVRIFARQMAEEWREVYKNHKLNYELMEVGDDCERVKLLMSLGEIKVVETVAVDTTAFIGGKVAYTDNGQPILRKRPFAIFERI